MFRHLHLHWEQPILLVCFVLSCFDGECMCKFNQGDFKGGWQCWDSLRRTLEASPPQLLSHCLQAWHLSGQGQAQHLLVSRPTSASPPMLPAVLPPHPMQLRRAPWSETGKYPDGWHIQGEREPRHTQAAAHSDFIQRPGRAGARRGGGPGGRPKGQEAWPPRLQLNGIWRSARCSQKPGTCPGRRAPQG